jgi:hypothetical protein
MVSGRGADRAISGSGLYAECEEMPGVSGSVRWIRSKPWIVAGHGVLGPHSSPRHIEATRTYIRDVNATVAGASTAVDFYTKMLPLRPNALTQGGSGPLQRL